LGVEQDLSRADEILRYAALNGCDLWNDIYALDYQMQEVKKGNTRNQGMSLYMDYLKAKTMGESDALPILAKSADSSWSPAQEELWSTYRQNKEYNKGMPYLQKAVAANFIPAFFEMGYMYDAGLNTKIDYAQAANWYGKAAAEDYPPAQNNLGSLYYNEKIAAGNGYSNREMASYWFNLSAEQGNADAIKNQKQVAKQIKLENTVEILNALAAVTSATADIANAVAPSTQAAPPSASAQNNASTPQNTSSGKSNSPGRLTISGFPYSYNSVYSVTVINNNPQKVSDYHKYKVVYGSGNMVSKGSVRWISNRVPPNGSSYTIVLIRQVGAHDTYYYKATGVSITDGNASVDWSRFGLWEHTNTGPSVPNYTYGSN